MAPDDPSDSVREFRFKHGSYHVIIIVDADGAGSVRVIGDFFIEPPIDEKKASLVETLNMLSIARHLAWEEYTKLGGSIEELNTQRVKKL